MLIVEDIVDSGVTLNYLMHVLEQRKPHSIRIAALLDKPERRLRPVEVSYVGFQIPDEFVVGYGLDYAERYRNLDAVCVLDGGRQIRRHCCRTLRGGSCDGSPQCPRICRRGTP